MNKFNAILNEVESKEEHANVVDLQHNELLDHVYRRISDYLGIDIRDFLIDTDAAIFGGAVRDSIADLKIHDVDILALPRAAKLISNRLSTAGFKLLHMSSTDIISIYRGIKLINEPWTFIKNDAIVQLIRPCASGTTSAIDIMNELLANVDISACGVYINYRGGVWEACSSAIEHCKKKSFFVLKDNLMHQKDRIVHRVAKLLDRGWTEIENVPVLINVDEKGVDVSISEGDWVAENPDSQTYPDSRIYTPRSMIEAMDIIQRTLPFPSQEIPFQGL